MNLLTRVKHLLANPVMVSELRGRIRDKRAMTLLTLNMIVVGTLIALLYLVFSSSVRDPGPQDAASFGRVTFYIVMTSLMVIACLLPTALAAGSIAGEKERQTYDLLLITTQSSWSIVIGKLLTVVALMGLMLISVLPLAGLSILFGGVSIQEMIVGTLGLCATVILFSSIGIFGSALMKTVPRANMISLGVMSFWLVAFPVLLWVGNTLLDSGWELSQQQEDLLFSPGVVYLAFIVLCFHPFIALGLTAFAIIEGEPLFWITWTMPHDRGDMLLPSPWWVYCIIAFCCSLVFLVLAAWRVKPVGFEDTTSAHKHASAHAEARQKVPPLRRLRNSLGFIARMRRVWSAEVGLIVLLAIIMTPIYSIKMYIDHQWELANRIGQHIDQGEALAREGDVEGAIHEFMQAQALNPNLNIDPAIKAQTIAAQPFLDQGYALAREGDIAGSIEHFTQAKELHPGLALEAEVEARRTMAQTTIANAEILAEQGNIEQAVQGIAEAQAISPTIEVNAGSWHMLCWWGSVWEAAPHVLDACNQAVLLLPLDANMRYSRGIARALTGDYAGARDDMHFYLIAREQTPPSAAFESVTREEQREWLEEQREWLLELEAGRNPFDTETLEQLRSAGPPR